MPPTVTSTLTDTPARPDAPARRPRRDAARNHQLVLEAARDLLGEYGPEASMEQIAARAGVGVGTVYRRFPGKDSLVAELVTLVTAELVEAGQQLLAHDDGTGLERLLRVIGQSFQDHRRWAGLLLPCSPLARSSGSEVRAQLSLLLENAHQAGTIAAEVRLGDVMALVWSLRGLLESLGDVAPDAWRRYLDIHLAGLRSPEPLSATPAIMAAQLEQLPAPRTVVHAAR
jgi:AcrR family transcriptional regulator